MVGAVEDRRANREDSASWQKPYTYLYAAENIQGEERVVVGGGKNWAERYRTSKVERGGRGRALQSVLPLTPSMPVPRVVGVAGGGRDGG